MGGNPDLGRTTPDRLILLCVFRHLGRISLDAKTIRIVPLTEAGTRGPVRWQIRDWVIADWQRSLLPVDIDESHWFTLCDEGQPLTDGQQVMIAWLAQSI